MLQQLAAVAAFATAAVVEEASEPGQTGLVAVGAAELLAVGQNGRAVCDEPSFVVAVVANESRVASSSCLAVVVDAAPAADVESDSLAAADVAFEAAAAAGRASHVDWALRLVEIVKRWRRYQVHLKVHPLSTSQNPYQKGTGGWHCLDFHRY